METCAEESRRMYLKFFLATHFAIFYLTPLLIAFYDGRGFAAQSLDNLGFFKVVDDKSSYERQRDEFVVVKFKGARGVYERYVAKRPSHEIPLESIRSITIRKQKVYGSANPAEEIARGSFSFKSRDQASKETYPYGYVYNASFQLVDKAVISFKRFANANEGQRFDLTFAKNRLGTVQFIGSFDSNEFATFLENLNSEELKVIFSPARDKTKWE